MVWAYRRIDLIPRLARAFWEADFEVVAALEDGGRTNVGREEDWFLDWADVVTTRADRLLGSTLALVLARVITLARAVDDWRGCWIIWRLVLLAVVVEITQRRGTWSVRPGIAIELSSMAIGAVGMRTATPIRISCQLYGATIDAACMHAPVEGGRACHWQRDTAAWAAVDWSASRHLDACDEEA
jgi:hypothetical protein